MIIPPSERQITEYLSLLIQKRDGKISFLLGNQDIKIVDKPWPDDYQLLS
jgi:hypothetical protein